MNHFEQPLHEWLEVKRFERVIMGDDGQPVKFVKDETDWPEIARYFLGLERREQWKDKSLQMQIANALKALGWRARPVWKYGRSTNVWRKQGEVPF
jgi:hypothetical protein